jgi:hypothetical protein
MANIKVNIDVDSGDVQIASDKVLTLQQQIKVLRQELQKTPEGTKEFNLLVGKLNDTRDAFDRVNIKGKEIFGTLGLIPGPIGEIAARTNSAIDALKIFGSFKTSDIKAQFSALKDDFIGVGKALGSLTGVTRVYTSTLNSLTTAEGAASTGARVLAASVATLYAALGVGVILAVVYAFSKLQSSQEYVKQATDETTASIKKQNEELEFQNKVVDNNAKAAISRLKIAGASEQEIKARQLVEAQKTAEKANKALLDIRKKYNENEAELIRLQGKSEYSLDELNIARKKEVALKNKGILGKEIDDRKAASQAANLALLDLQAKFAEEDRQVKKTAYDKDAALLEKNINEKKALREKELGELAKGRDEAYLELLTDQEAEEYKVTEQYVKLIELAIKYGQDTTIFEQALVDKLKEIRDKANTDRIEKEDKAAKERKDKEDKEVEEFLQRQQETDRFRFEQYNKIKELNQQRVDEELRQNQIIGQSWVSLGNNIANVFGALANTFSENEVLQKAFAVAQVAINTAASIGQIILSGKQQQADYNKAIAAGNSTILIGLANAFIPGFQAIAAAQIASGKAAVGAATAGKITAAANTKVQIGTAAAVGGLQIAAILSAKKPSTPSSGGGDTGGGASTPAFSTPTIGAPQIGPTSNQQGQIAGIVAGALERNNSQGRPIRAYVVGNDITSEQQLQRRLRTAARLGG